MTDDSTPAATTAHPQRPGELNHRLGHMSGRDPHEQGRVASPLELLFDLSFAVAFGTAGSNLAHLVAAGHTTAGLLGFCFCAFAIVWAWINFSWFASAYDTDDWLARIVTMVQMIGVVVMALGMPAMFHSVDHALAHHAGHLDNKVMVSGYIVMRLAMFVQWSRAHHDDPSRRPAIRAYLTTLLLAQVGWTVLAWAPLGLWSSLVLSAVLVCVELTGPVVAEFSRGGTPWHAHHMVERYSLLAIITLGEGVVGTVASLSSVVAEGWHAEAVMVVVAGIGLTFAMWWIYFAATMPEVLHAHRERSFGFGYLHIITFAAIAATGAGLHVAGYLMGGESQLSVAGAVTAVAVPVGIYVLSIFALWNNMARHWDGLHTVLVLLTVAVLAGAVVLARAGAGLGPCLLVVMIAPVVTVVGYEAFGHRHLAATLEREAA